MHRCINISGEKCRRTGPMTERINNIGGNSLDAFNPETSKDLVIIARVKER